MIRPTHPAQSSPTQKVKFSETVEFAGGGHPELARVFQAGKTYDLPADVANKWVVRRKAEYVPQDTDERGETVDKETQALRERLLSERQGAQVAAQEPIPAPPKLSAAEERASRVEATSGGDKPEADDATKDVDPLAAKDAQKAVTAPPRSKIVKPGTQRNK